MSPIPDHGQAHYRQDGQPPTTEVIYPFTTRKNRSSGFGKRRAYNQVYIAYGMRQVSSLNTTFIFSKDILL